MRTYTASSLLDDLLHICKKRKVEPYDIVERAIDFFLDFPDASTSAPSSSSAGGVGSSSLKNLPTLTAVDAAGERRQIGHPTLYPDMDDLMKL